MDQLNLPNSRERAVTSTVGRVCSESVKTDKHLKGALINNLRSDLTINKSAVSRNLGISRTTLNRVRTTGSKKTSPEVRQVVAEFFTQMNVSTTYPNKTKSQHPLYVLKDSAHSLYKKFQQSHPHLGISFTTFWKLKPKYVKKQSAAKLLQCVCDICENIELLLTCISASITRSVLETPEFLKRGKTTERRAMELALSTLCHRSLYSRACLDRQCSSCGTSKINDLLLPWAQSDEEEVNYFKWCYESRQVKGKAVKRLTKVSHRGNKLAVVNELISQLGPYGRHVFIQCSQTNAFRDCKSFSSPVQAVVVVDFAENYTCIRQGEAQSAYYSRQQVTLHPMVVTINTDMGPVRDSVVAISDDLVHDHISVSCFFKVLFEHLQKLYPSVNEVIVWSDGCSSQYKSCKPFFNLSRNFGSEHFKLVWNFYGSRHGKGAADGETGVIKSALGRMTQDTEVVIDSADDVYQALSNSRLAISDGTSRRHFYMVTSAVIEDMRKATANISISTVAGTRKLHQITAHAGKGSVVFRDLSCYCVCQPCQHKDNDWKTHEFKGTK